MRTLLRCPYGHDSEFVQKQTDADTSHITCQTCKRIFQIKRMMATEWDMAYERRIIVAQWNEICEIESETAMRENQRRPGWGTLSEYLVYWSGPSLEFVTVQE